MTPQESPQVGTESFSSAVVIPQSYTAYRDETCESASRVPLPTFPNDSELELTVAADRELKGILDKVTDIEDMARKPLNTALKKMRAQRDDFLAKVVKEHNRLAAGIKAFQTARVLQNQAEARRLEEEQRNAAWEAAAAQRKIEEQQREIERHRLALEREELTKKQRAEVEKKQEAAKTELLAAQLKAEEAALTSQSVETQLTTPTNTPRGLTTKTRWDFEIVNHQKCVEEMSTFILWKKDEELWKFDRAGFLKSLNQEGSGNPSPFLPKEGEREAVNSRVGIRVFIDVRSNVRA